MTRGINLAVTTPITVSNVAAEEIVHRLDRTRYLRPRTGAAAWESDQVFRSANIELVTPGRRHPYFAYGSNLCVRQMALRCPDASGPRRAVLADHDWLINQRGVATVEPFDGTQVHGVVWQLSDHDLATLDSAEGVPERYRRNRLTVHTRRRAVGRVGLHRPPGESGSAATWLPGAHHRRGSCITGCHSAGSTSCADGILPVGLAHDHGQQRLHHSPFPICSPRPGWSRSAGCGRVSVSWQFMAAAWKK